MRFEWDRRKSAANLEKHGLAFEDADTVFAGKCVTFLDDRMDYGEERYLTLGLLMGRVRPYRSWLRHKNHFDEKSQ